MAKEPASPDSRTPSPPFGYSRTCPFDRDKQVEIVAEFHAHRIRPARIAYRVGIDIAFIEALIAGEEEPERFPALVAHYRRQRYRDRLRASEAQRGTARYERQQRAAREFEEETGL